MWSLRGLCAVASATLALGQSVVLAAPAARVAGRTVVVSPVVGDPFASGVALRQAYASAPSATAEYPVLVKLEPGTYDIGRVPLLLDRPHVHLEGSGREATIIRGWGPWVLVTRVDVSVQRLTVETTNGHGITMEYGRFDFRELRVRASRDTPTAGVLGVRAVAGAYGRLHDVLIEAANPSGYVEALGLLSSATERSEVERVEIRAAAGLSATGLYLGAPTLVEDTRIDSSHIGVSVISNGGSPTVTLVGLRVDGATQFGLVSGSDGVSSVSVRDSALGGAVRSIKLEPLSTMNLKVANSLITSPVEAPPPNTLTCVGTYDAAFQPLGAACQ